MRWLLMRGRTIAVLKLFCCASVPCLSIEAQADWPMLRGGPEHSGYVSAQLNRPLQLTWAREFEGERLGTAMEPIIAGGQLLVGTHSGNLYASDAISGVPIWRFHANGPFLHSPAAANGFVFVASGDGFLNALDAKTGEPRWERFLNEGGASASPLISGGKIFLGTRRGEFVCLDLFNGHEQWRTSLGVPIRQTAAFAEGRIFVTAEDLRVRAFDAESGKRIWQSEPLSGQTARDYYPIIVRAGARSFVVVRTNPILNMGQQIGRDRSFLARMAGADDSNWRKTEEWIASDRSHGSPDLWAREQKAIIAYLQTNRTAQTFFVLDAANGNEAFIPPVLWIAGCQGVGAEPAVTSDGRLLVFYRSAYGNWNHGVAPFVTLGLYDLAKNEITPLFHQQGKKPPWNCFWGTADESQNFLVIGDTVLIDHQGTLSGFDLRKNELFPIYGERDTFGGFRSPAWARNEWHGPARAGVAVSDGRLYWQTGSRILCLGSGQRGPKSQIATTRAAEVRSTSAPTSAAVSVETLRSELARVVAEVISTNWAPLFIDPGLAGRDFSFDKSSDVFEALSWAYPHVSRELRSSIENRLRREWREHPPYESSGFLALREGSPREFFKVPVEYRARLGSDKLVHPFAGVYAAWFYAQRCQATNEVISAFPAMKRSFESFVASGWKFDPSKGDVHANGYLAALLSYARLAVMANDGSGVEAERLAERTSDALAEWWKNARGTLTNFAGSAELDPFINKGDLISLRLAPHRHKLALFHELSPEVAAIIRMRALGAIEGVWEQFERLYATWFIVGEERQVHSGENFVDPPDLALGGFKAQYFLRPAGRAETRTRIDLPFCRADLFYLTKLALALE